MTRDHFLRAQQTATTQTQLDALRADLARSLLGQCVRFWWDERAVLPAARVTATTPYGLVMLDGWPGAFSPQVFVVVSVTP